MGGGREGKNVWVDVPGFCGSVVCAGYIPRVHNDCYLISSLESISPSRSSTGEDSTILAGQTRLTESGKLD